ncbi:hypothetical protein DsansV1_C01g0005911 [Dioscorea sansibarensis]
MELCPITSWHLSCFKLLSETQRGNTWRESSAIGFYIESSNSSLYVILSSIFSSFLP